jgi:5-methylcytosine-specific restriction endonuclease McrA
MLILRSKRFGVEQPPFTATMKRRVKLQFKSVCFNCSSTTRLQFGHHKPLYLGNALVYGNCVILCRRCNLIKGTTPPEHFYSKTKLARLEALLAAQRTFAK